MEEKKINLVESNEIKIGINEDNFNIVIKDFVIESPKNDDYYDLKFKGQNEKDICENNLIENKSVSDYDDNKIISENKNSLFIKPKSSKYVKQEKAMFENINHNGAIMCKPFINEFNHFPAYKEKPNSRSFTNLNFEGNSKNNKINKNEIGKNDKLGNTSDIDNNNNYLKKFNTNFLMKNHNLRYNLNEVVNTIESNCKYSYENDDITKHNYNLNNSIDNNRINHLNNHVLENSNGKINSKTNNDIKENINDDANLITLGSIVLSSKSEEHKEKEKLKSLNTNSNSINLSIIDIKISRFNEKNIPEGSEFYKLRYICRKLKEIHRNGLKVFLDENNKLKSDNRQVIQFNRLFLVKMETSFFQFNLQKFQESFQTLKENEIIDNEEEFVEVLILFFGFNKHMIGEFISKNKGMNKGLCMLYFFIHKLNFENVDFLQAFRFLWQTIIPPKDTNLVLEIINVFTIVYEKDNPKFYNSDELYLLCSTIMALNTSLHKNLETVQPIPLKDFIRMNVGLNPKYLEYIYNNLKLSKLDFKNDFQENFVNLAIEIQKIKGENTNLNSQPQEALNLTKNIKLTNEAKEISSNSNVKLEVKRIKDLNQYNKNYNEEIKMLKDGELFTKYGNKGDPHKRRVFLSEDIQFICWSNPTCSYFSTVNKIPIIELKNCYFGVQQSDIFGKYKIGKEFESNCFSIVSSKRTIDLRHDSETIVKNWFKALKNLISNHQIEEKIKKKQLKSNSILIIDEIWKSTILPNWDKYREFLFDVNFFNISKDNSLKQFFEDLIKSKNKMIEKMKQDQSNFRYIWTLGIPEFIRNKMWKMLIKNALFINEALFSKLIDNFHTNKINLGNSVNFAGNLLIDSVNSKFNNKLDQIIFDDKITDLNYIKEEKGFENVSQNYLLNEEEDVENDQNIDKKKTNDYRKKSFILLEKIKKSNELKISNDENNLFYTMVLEDINKAMLDLDISQEDLKNYKISHYENSSNEEISNIKISNKSLKEDILLENFKKEVLLIILCFNGFRKDISYNIDLSYITLVITCNSDNYFQAFVNLTNFICGSYLIHFLKDNEKFAKSRINFMDTVFKEHLPRLYDQFKHLGYSINLFFYDWIPSLFSKYFKIKTVNRLLDIYLIKKEVFVFEVALGILLFIDKDLRQCTFNDLKSDLLSFNSAYCDDDFFELLNKIDLKASFNKMISDNLIIYEKNLLNDEYLYDK